jgi:hypothetical protein
LGLETRCTERSSVATACAPNRAFQIGVISANRILIAKVMAKSLQRIQKLPQLGQIMISCQFCADPPAPSISAPLMCNLTAQRHLTRILLHHPNRLKGWFQPRPCLAMGDGSNCLSLYVDIYKFLNFFFLIVYTICNCF